MRNLKLLKCYQNLGLTGFRVQNTSNFGFGIFIKFSWFLGWKFQLRDIFWGFSSVGKTNYKLGSQSYQVQIQFNLLWNDTFEVLTQLKLMPSTIWPLTKKYLLRRWQRLLLKFFFIALHQSFRILHWTL